LLRASARLRPTSDATTVQVHDGKALISDGRFAETTEQIGGYCLGGARIAWAALGPYFHYSDTRQLVVNTATTIVTFLMVFLIQNTQNRDARAIHLKLDEIIRSIQPAHNEMIDIEKLSDEELEALSKKFEAIREECQARRRD
jgi:low affinity Fe/Cu permease